MSRTLDRTLDQPSTNLRARSDAVTLGLILGAYACARILEVVSSPVPRMAIVALDVLSAMAFAITDGARHYGRRTILVFAAICVVVGNLVENVGVITGFPFGRYYFVELMGPKLFHVPVLLGMAYVGMAYVSWTLAWVILGQVESFVEGARILTLPLLASLIMTAWDLAQDPVWATVLHGWVWRDGGAWFGVPLSNYFGWYFTVFGIYLLFALYLRRSSVPAPSARRGSGWPALVFYGVCAAGNILQMAPRPIHAAVQDSSGRWWQVAHITAASALVSVFGMGTMVAIAAFKLAQQKKLATD